jgi:hypothetical protein
MAGCDWWVMTEIFRVVVIGWLISELWISASRTSRSGKVLAALHAVESADQSGRPGERLKCVLASDAVPRARNAFSLL